MALPLKGQPPAADQCLRATFMPTAIPIASTSKSTATYPIIIMNILIKLPPQFRS